MYVYVIVLCAPGSNVRLPTYVLFFVCCEQRKVNRIR